MRFVFVLLLALLSLPSSVDAQAAVATFPPAPSLSNDLRGFEKDGNGDYQFTNPYLPPLTTSQDHRVGLIRKRAGNGNQAVFHLVVPERLDTELMLAGAGSQALSPVAVFRDADLFHSGPGATTTHFALCDPKESAPNPYVCGEKDCYYMVVVTAVKLVDPSGPDQLKLFSTPITVEVSQPKTADAKIDDVIVHTDLQRDATPIGNVGDGLLEFHTPMIVGDNRLMVFRVGARSDLQWQNGSTTVTGSYDTIYAYDPLGAECDIDNWQNFKPLTFAPDDPDLRFPDQSPRFGFAAYPFRSPSGRKVADYHPGNGQVVDINTRYIWLDQAANNIFFGSTYRQLIDYAGPGNNLYPIECVPGSGCSVQDTDSEALASHLAWMMMGLWTHGKMVLLDSTINHTDFGLHGEEENHRRVGLYADTVPGTTDDSHVQVGGGEDSSVIDSVAASPYGWIYTTVQFGSMENFLHMARSENTPGVLPMQPRTPRDVVWAVTTGAQTDEVAFDDYLSLRNLVFSPMNALREMVGNNVYWDGFHQTTNPALREKRLQNAATGLRWELPEYGKVVAPDATKGRIEHVAMGGIKARGFHLDPATRIEYVVPSQDAALQMPLQEWMISLFFDWTVNPIGTVRRIATLPGGCEINMHGLSLLRVCAPGGAPCQSVTMPRPLFQVDWTHLAFHLRPDASQPTMRFYQDGFLFAEVPLPSGMTIDSGLLTIGSPDGSIQGIGGWIDDLRVVEGPFNLEEVCNQARGTLVAVPHTYAGMSGTPLTDRLGWFETGLGFANALSGRQAVHQALYGVSTSTGSDYYVCNVDYTDPLGISVHDPGDPEARSIRRRLLFPEGPIVWDEQRADSSNNAFCLACHAQGEEGGLSLDALVLDSSMRPAVDDPRRQPSQAPLEILGEIPAGAFGPGKPAADTEDELIDRWIHDGPLYHWPMDEGSGSTIDNAVIGDVRDPAVSSNGTIHGATFVAGKGRGHGLHFDVAQGSGLAVEMVTIDHNVDIVGDGLTLAAWFELGANPSTRCDNFQNGHPCTLIAKSATTNHDVDWALRVFEHQDDNIWRAQFQIKSGSGAGTLRTATAILAGFDPSGWHHIAGSYDSAAGEMVIYVDGLEVERENNVASGLSTDVNHEVTLGARLNVNVGGAIHPFYGTLDDVRIYNRPLRAEEVALLVIATP
ncbi:MAG: LamG-like jellyroll fold domain-containing protein [Acidobacteriota bacterium]